MNRTLVSAALAFAAAAALTGCSGGASAAPAATVTVTATPEATTAASPSTPTAPPVAAGSTFDTARAFVTDILNGQKASAASVMTPAAATSMKSTSVKDYLFGGRDEKSCQVAPAELKLQKPNAADHRAPFSTDGGETRPGSSVTAVEVLCNADSFGVIVAILGDDHRVDGVEYRLLPNAEVFAAK